MPNGYRRERRPEGHGVRRSESPDSPPRSSHHPAEAFSIIGQVLRNGTRGLLPNDLDVLLQNVFGDGQYISAL